jgi:hypothetical protein
MPLLFTDPYSGGQQLIDSGKSQITPRETYGVSDKGINAQYADSMHNVNQLANSLSSFAGVADQARKQQQQQIDDAAELTKDGVSGLRQEMVSGGEAGVFSRVMGNIFGPPSVSPHVQFRIAARSGNDEAVKALTTNPDFIKLNANADLLNDPKEYDRQLQALLKSSTTQFFASNSRYANDPMLRQMFEGGFLTAAKNLADQKRSDSVKAATLETQRQNSIAADANDAALNPAASTRATVQRVAQAAGADPAMADQYLAIENPKLNTGAVAGTPRGGTYSTATGLFQITDARWDDIKARMKAAGQGDIADTLTDRKDPVQNTQAWAWEVKRNKEQAAAALGREPTTAETYMYWVSPAAAPKVLSALANNPDTKVSDVVDPVAIKNNPKVFGDGEQSVSTMITNLNKSMKSGSIYHSETTQLAAIPKVMLTADTWDNNSTKWKYQWSDFKNSGEYGGQGSIDSRSVSALDQLSTLLGRKIGITSANRTTDYNDSVGGAKNSRHIHGDALDINITDPAEQRKAVRFLSSIGVQGIGVYNGWIHMDIGGDRAWSKRGDLPVDEVRQLISEGRKDSASGNYIRNTGYQGKPYDPFEHRIQAYRDRGISASDARERVFNNTIQAAYDKARGNDPAGAQLDLANLYSGFNAISDKERNDVRAAQSQVETIQRTAFEARKQAEIRDAETYQKAEEKKMYEAHAKGEKYLPDFKSAPQTAAGRTAYAALNELGIAGLESVSPDVNNSNVNLLKNRLEDPTLYKELGYEGDDRPKNYAEMRDAVHKAKRGQFSLAGLDEVAKAWELRRQAGPIGEQMATQSTTEMRARIHDAFTQNTDALQKINNMFENPAAFQSKLKEYTDKMELFYKDNYAVLYKNAMARSGNGNPLDFDQQKAIEKSALDNTTAYGRSLASIVSASAPASPAQRIQKETFLTDPSSAAAMILASRGAPITAPIPGVPRGSMVVLGANGEPQITGDGSYQMKLPDGSVFYYNPVFSAAQASPVNMADESNFSTPSNTISEPAAAPVPQTKQERGAVVKEQVRQAEQASAQKFETEYAQRHEAGKAAVFTDRVNSYVRQMVESEFQGRMNDAKSPKETKQIAKDVEARYEQLTKHYTKELKPYYDALVQARKHFAEVPPEQRAAASRAVQQAAEAYEALFQ